MCKKESLGAKRETVISQRKGGREGGRKRGANEGEKRESGRVSTS
jgi:hypothetical protein